MRNLKKTHVKHLTEPPTKSAAARKKKPGFATADVLQSRIAANIEALVKRKSLQFRQLKSISLTTLYRVRNNMVKLSVPQLVSLADELQVDLRKLMFSDLTSKGRSRPKKRGKKS